MWYKLCKVIVFIGLKVVSGVCFVLSTPYYFQTKRKCSSINNKLLLYPAGDLVKMIAAKEVLCEDVISAYISRIKEVNPLLNAVVEDKFEESILKAKHIDKLVCNSGMSTKDLLEKYPLLGLPLTIKESISLEGASHTSGKVFEGGRKATSDAVIVTLCKNAGAIPLLVSNTPEMSANFETYNNVTGITCNPYDHRRTCGGSSGGEGALLAAGASLIGIGSDIFGSLRLPAHYCGVWGHKPSPFAVPIEGHYPNGTNIEEWKTVFTLGPMARYASDLSLVLEVISQNKLQLNTPVDVKNIKFYYMDYNYSLLQRKFDKETNNAIARLINYISLSYPGNVNKIHLNEFKYTPEMSIIKLFNIDDVEEIFENSGKKWLNKILLYVTRQSKCTFTIVLLHILKRLYSIFMPDTVITNSENTLNKLRDNLTELLGDNGVLLYPCHPTSAHFHGKFFGHILDYSLMGVFNCLGFPVTNCTLGLNSRGLPVGIQVVAATSNDRLSLAVAQEIEKAFGGWVPP